MKLDSENDRKILLELISRSQIAGGAAPVIADLMQRLSVAQVETVSPDKGETPRGR
jgi:hypothetical protein